MAEERKIRLISPEPTLANLLRELEKKGIRIQMIPLEYRNFIVDWIADIGVVMRDRSFMAYSAAMYLSTAVIMLPFELAPSLKQLPLLTRIFGVRR